MVHEWCLEAGGQKAVDHVFRINPSRVFDFPISKGTEDETLRPILKKRKLSIGLTGEQFMKHFDADLFFDAMGIEEKNRKHDLEQVLSSCWIPSPEAAGRLFCSCSS
jgi:hypothetical protein